MLVKRQKRDATELIRGLEESVDSLLYFTQRKEGTYWRKKLNLEDKSTIDEELENLQQREEHFLFYQKSAAYIAIVQLLFYRIYRLHYYEFCISVKREDINFRSLISTKGIPKLIQRRIESMTGYNLSFSSIFGEIQIFPELDEDASQTLFEIIQYLEDISKEELIENDTIGQVFQRLLPFKIRKKLAAFYTNNKGAELLCEFAIDDALAQVYDPACGSGTLLVKAYQRKRTLSLKGGSKLLGSISGSDISKMTAAIATANLAIQDLDDRTNQLKVFTHDFFSLVESIGSTSKRLMIVPNSNSVSSVVKSTTFFEYLTEEVDLIIGNPPFTRGENLEPVYRRYLAKHILFRELKINLSRVGLHAYFLVAAVKLLRKSKARVSFILPFAAIGSSMQNIWDIVFRHGFGIKVIAIASDSDEAFSDSRLHEIIVIAEKGYLGKCRRVKLVGKLESKNISNLVQSINKIEDNRGMTQHFIYQNVNQQWLRNRSCEEWGRVNYSLFLEGFYNKLIPLDLSKYKRALNDSRNSKEDLSSFIKVISACKYTPIDFWLLPNKFWQITEATEEELKIQATSLNTVIYGENVSTRIPSTLTLPMSIFSKALGNSIRQYKKLSSYYSSRLSL